MWVYWLSDFDFEGYKFWYVGIIIITIIVTISHSFGLMF